MPRPQLKRLLKLAGHGVVIASLVFLGVSLAEKYGEISFAAWRPSDFLLIAAASVIYTAAMLLMALCWAVMLSGKNDRLSAAVIVYSNTAVLKYLPGNVFHLVGRNVGGFAAQRGHWRVASATIFELILSMMVSLFLAAAFFSFVDGPVPFWAARLLLAGLAIAIVGFVFLPRIVGWKVVNRLPAVSRLRLPLNLGAATVYAFASYVLILVAASVVSASVLLPSAGWQVAAPTFILAWFLGFIVPGAPGGVGVREAAIVLVLSPYAPEADALMFALVMRLVSTAADLGLFGVGKMLAFARPDPAAQP